jgi:hypothetical protein
LAFAVGFVLLSISAFRGNPLGVPESLKRAIDGVCSPAAVSASFFAAMVFVYLARDFFAKPTVAWIGLNAAAVFFSASLADPNFYAAATRPDDVPVVAMVFFLGFFLWLALHQAVENDRRMFTISPLQFGEGQGGGAIPVEKEFSEKVLTWPDLVYSELICILLLSTGLIVWSLLLPAPLEQPANPAVTPNPSKAPWYFVGLQEMLTYSDAWNAGIVVPLLAFLGLMAIPYLDRNPKGSGYYSLRGRRFAVFVFLFGFLQLWILPILIGVFLRGPNWSSFGLYEIRDPGKLAAAEHFSLAQAFWRNLLARPAPQAPADAGRFVQLQCLFLRDLPGIGLSILYFLALPLAAAKTFMKSLYRELGCGRYLLAAFLFLYMMTLPLKMIARWLFGVDSFFG